MLASDPLPASTIARKRRLSDLAWNGEGTQLVWLEGRADRAALVAADVHGRWMRDLNRGWTVQARVGYGGGEFCLCGDCVVFASGDEIHSQELQSPLPSRLFCGNHPVAAPRPSPDGREIVFIQSGPEGDRLCSIPSQGGRATILDAGSDFVMQPCWHPNGKWLAWVSWNHPDMPWEQSSIRLAQVSRAGQDLVLNAVRTVDSGTNDRAGVFQPGFSPDGRFLAAVSDEEGWANLSLYRTDDWHVERRIEDEAEHGLPAWVQGMRTWAWSPDSSALFIIRQKGPLSSLMRFCVETGRYDPVPGDLEEFSSLSQLAVSPAGSRLALIASSPRREPRILVFSETGRILQSFGPAAHAEPVSAPLSEAVSWSGPEATLHGLLSRPDVRSTSTTVPPLPAVIKVHGGPTSCAQAGYDPDTLFFTSRGFLVLDLNYRGSSGYGRPYRESLNLNWGKADVADVRRAADYLVTRHDADPRRLVLVGGSAGGFTVLLSLIRFPGVFRAAVCRYPVTDPLAIARDTHRFEIGYLDSLIGPLPGDEQKYRERSPLLLAGHIKDPVAIFQGDADQVVPRSQVDLFVTCLKEHSVPHLYQVFPGEGHGWRKPATTLAYYTQLERFLRQQLKL